VDRALDGAAHAHAYHGYVRAADAGRTQAVAGALRRGLQDGLLGGAVGLPLMRPERIERASRSATIGSGEFSERCVGRRGRAGRSAEATRRRARW
jgi:hypothetical protein